MLPVEQLENAWEVAKLALWGWGCKFSHLGRKMGRDALPGCREKQDTLQEQNSELVFISAWTRGNI